MMPPHSLLQLYHQILNRCFLLLELEHLLLLSHQCQPFLQIQALQIQMTC
ncbi:hypothetical protein NC651_006947 [Populus alba x Populus x berolinensis]|nr:hypothetical protein NC651_006947 [Populus alba x Populus x berolinensis]